MPSEASAAMKFSIATYNIHKGFSHLTRRMVIHELKEKLHGLSADLLFLQEVQGLHNRHAGRYHDWPGKPQHEFIADTMWREVAYGAQCELPQRPPRQCRAVALSDRHARERGHLRTRVREPRHAPLRSEDRRQRTDAPLHQRAPRPLRAGPHLADSCAGRTHPRDRPARRADDHRRRLQRLAAQGRPHADRRTRRVRSVRGGQGPSGAHLSLGDADVPPGSNLRARIERGRRPRALRLSRKAACPTTQRSRPRSRYRASASSARRR